LLKLTAEGLKLLARAVPIWERTHLEIESGLPDSDPNELRESLGALARSPTSE
jgi:DNA-binding MarR family transcriptional regulator